MSPSTGASTSPTASTTPPTRSRARNRRQPEDSLSLSLDDLDRQGPLVPMTDGVRLATDVFRLQDGPPTPVLLVRTPTARTTQSSAGQTRSTFSAQSTG